MDICISYNSLYNLLENRQFDTKYYQPSQPHTKSNQDKGGGLNGYYQSTYNIRVLSITYSFVQNQYQTQISFLLFSYFYTCLKVISNAL